MGDANERTVGSFVAERALGEGGMGVVFLARHPALERRVVLKQLRKDLASKPELVERFHREARAAAAVQHQNVVTVYDCFSCRGDYYIAQEFVDGIDLATAIARVGRIDPRIATLILLEVLRGLEEIHANGTIHRDLKPANILLGRGGEVKIGDFGIALERRDSPLTEPGVMLGSPPYMPPEQLLGEPVDYRGDLFSLGVVLYEMLAGSRPFRVPEKEGEPSSLSQIQQGRYRRIRQLVPEVPRYVARWLQASLSARPEKRPASATAIRLGLERRLGHPTSAACRAEISTWLADRAVIPMESGDTVVLPVQKPARPRRQLRWAVAVLLLGLVATSVLVVRFEAWTVLKEPFRGSR
ncbi:MAG: serine/threonine-protein kinase [Myxococcota bacterium]